MKMSLNKDPGPWSLVTFAIFLYLVASLGLLAPSLDRIMGCVK